jgi:phosphopantetheinyl transferase
VKYKLISHDSVYIGLTHQQYTDDWQRDLADYGHSIEATPTSSSFICGRGLLYDLIRTYGSDADNIAILHTSDTGRLILIGSDWYVSVSHANSWTVAGISRAPFGIDIELRNREVDWKSIVEMQFSDSIANRIFSHQEHERLQAFLREWTLIEASAKINKGLALPVIDSDIAKSSDFFDTDALVGCIVTSAHKLRSSDSFNAKQSRPYALKSLTK